MCSPCRAGACAGAEVKSNHHLATLTVEPFHRMQFRSGILLGPIFHAGPKTCALAFSFQFQSPVPYLTRMHLWVSYTRSNHFIRSIGSSPCRASACAYAEVNCNHHLATLTIEPFHRMQFRNGIHLGPIFHVVPKTCACARSFHFPSPATYRSCMHLWAIYTRSLHFISVNLVLSMPRWRLRRHGGQFQSRSIHPHDRVIGSLFCSHNYAIHITQCRNGFSLG